MSKKMNWTPEQVELLRKHYSSTSSKALIEILGCDVDEQQINSKGSGLGLKRNKSLLASRMRAVHASRYVTRTDGKKSSVRPQRIVSKLPVPETRSSQQTEISGVYRIPAAKIRELPPEIHEVETDEDYYTSLEQPVVETKVVTHIGSKYT